MIWKLVKRNKGFSAGVSAALLILVCSSWFLFKAWRTAENNYTDYKKEQADKQERTETAVPALVRSAWFAADKQDYKTALAQVDLALTYAPEHAEARLLRGQLLIVQRDFAKARQEFAQYLQLKPTDAKAKELEGLCERPNPDDEATSIAFARVFTQQDASGLIDGVLARWGRTSTEARNQLQEKYRKQIERHSWDRNRLTMTTSGLHYSFDGIAPATSLDPLRGIPLTSLSLKGCSQVSDLSPLRGMPLRALDLTYCSQIRDLSPLKGMPLTHLRLLGCGASDLTPLLGMPLQALECGYSSPVVDLTPLKGMKLSYLNITGSGPVRDLTPLKGMELEDIRILPGNIKTGMSILREMKSLKRIGTGHEDKDVWPADHFWRKYDKGEF
jgi:hypothetical protein